MSHMIRNIPSVQAIDEGLVPNDQTNQEFPFNCTLCVAGVYHIAGFQS
jgi:hypothetical protein